MRLLNTNTCQFEEFQDLCDAPPYAILSHTWRSKAEGGEQTYEQLRKIQELYGLDGCRLDPLPAASAPPLSLTVCPCPCCARNHTLVYSTTTRPALIQPSTVDAAQPSGSTASADAQAPVLDPAPVSCIASDAGVVATLPRTIWEDPKLSPKIREACRVARENGYEWMWIDSSCIDKSSSSELSEAINSMYLWYERADVCYAFLAGVHAEDDHRAEGSGFSRSKWFTRGWTLQELIAPADVVFFSDDWTRIGSKHSLAPLIEDITKINYKALLHLEKLERFSVAQRLSWAAKRMTTREEDRAYSLLGIFDINMPTIYGEGNRAFRRLQEEIMRRVPDQSLFVWKDVYLERFTSPILPEVDTPASVPDSRHYTFGESSWGDGRSLLAPSLPVFREGGKIRGIPHDEVFRRLRLPDGIRPTEYNSTPHGIRLILPVIPLSQYLSTATTKCPDEVPLAQWYVAILGCEHHDFQGHLLGRVCYIPPSDSGVNLLYCGYVAIGSQPAVHLLPLSPPTIERCRSNIVPKTVYIPHPERADASTSNDQRCWPHKAIKLMLVAETQDALLHKGYTADLRCPGQDRPGTHEPHRLRLANDEHTITLSNDEHTITVEYRHPLEGDGHRFTITGHVQVSLRSSLPDSAAHDHEADTGETVYWTSRTELNSFRKQEWPATLGNKSVTLNAGGDRTYPVRVTLGFDHAGFGYYILRLDVHNDRTAACSSSPAEPLQGGERRVSGTGSDGNGRSDEGEVERGDGDSDSERTGEDGSSPASMADADEDAAVGRPEEDAEAADEREARAETDEEVGEAVKDGCEPPDASWA